MLINYLFFRNALSLAMLDELKARLIDASTDIKVKVIILGHTGSVFSAGHDLKELVGIIFTLFNYFLCEKIIEKTDIIFII